MDGFEEMLAILNELVFEKTGKQLDQTETLIVKAAWLDSDYKEIAGKNSPQSADYLQRSVERYLWTLLTGILGDGEKVTKKRFRELMERRIAQVKLTSPANFLASSDLSNIIGRLPDNSTFVGRDLELNQFRELTLNNRCVVLYGAVGIGKSATAAKFVEHQISAEPSDFTCFVWKSVHYAPSLSNLLSDLLKILAPTDRLPQTIQDKTALLIQILQASRCLLVLDAAESWLRQHPNSSFNPYEEQYSEYGVFFRRIVEERHNSCILLTSREPFKDLMKLERSGRPSYSLLLSGLDLAAAKQILKARGLTDENRWDELLEPYLGNPEAIKLVVNRVEYFFEGSVAKFLLLKTALISEIYREILQEQCREGRLTTLEKQILLHLVERMIDAPKEASGKITFSQLVNTMQANGKNISLSNLIEAVEALKRRSLIVVSKDLKNKEFMLQLPPIVEQYVLREKRCAARSEERVKLLSLAQKLFSTPETSEHFAI